LLPSFLISCFYGYAGQNNLKTFYFGVTPLHLTGQALWGCVAIGRRSAVSGLVDILGGEMNGRHSDDDSMRLA
jgi:hypothetical protein